MMKRLKDQSRARKKKGGALPQFDPEDFKPQRFGISYEPPMIILEYMLDSKGKLYLKKMKMLKIKQNTSPQVILKYLKMKYEGFFAPKKIKDQQIIRLVLRIQEYMKQHGIDDYIQYMERKKAMKEERDQKFEEQKREKEKEKEKLVKKVQENENGATSSHKKPPLAPSTDHHQPKGQNENEEEEDDDELNEENLAVDFDEIDDDE